MKKNKLLEKAGELWSKAEWVLVIVALCIVAVNREECVRPFIKVALVYLACDALLHIVRGIRRKLQKK